MSNIPNVTISADATVRVGKKTFTIDAAVKHASAVYDAMWLVQEQMLDHYREIGTILNGLQALFADNRKAFGQFLAGSELGSMSRQDRSDAMFIASEWVKVQKLNKDGALDTLGVSAIRKRLKASDGKASGAGKRKEEQAPKAEAPKAEVTPADVKAVKVQTEEEQAPKAEAPKAEVTPADVKAVKVQTEEELAALVYAMIQDNGLDFAKFAKALAVKRKGA